MRLDCAGHCTNGKKGIKTTWENDETYLLRRSANSIPIIINAYVITNVCWSVNASNITWR